MRLIDIHAHLVPPPERMGTAFVTNLPTASAPRRQAASARTPLAQGVLHALLARQEPEDPTGARASVQEALAPATELGMWPDATHRHLGLGKRYRRTSKRQDTRNLRRELDHAHHHQVAEHEDRTITVSSPR